MHLKENTYAPVALTQYRCFVNIIDGKLYSAPISPSGDIIDEWREITTLPSQKFLDTVNLVFGTTFSNENFDHQ